MAAIVQLTTQDIECLPNYRKKTAKEWSSTCPQCGGVDRFLFWPDDGNYYCRRCELSGFVTDAPGADLFRITPEMKAEWERQRLEREQEEHERHMSSIERLQAAGRDVVYHNSLRVTPEFYDFIDDAWGITPDTATHFFRNLRGFVTGKNRTDFVVQYPEELVDYSDAFRGMSVLVQLDNLQPKCVACGLCEFACPTDCISIVPGELQGSRIERYPEAFDIDMSRCMFCGLCEEACPEEAIVMSREVELATYDRGSMVYDKDNLLVPEALLKRRLDFLRGEYDREHAPAQSADGREQE
jgi:NADH-quinone oxidoreductase subunit I